MKAYLKKKNTPSRKARKSARNSIFWYNYTETRKRRAERRRAKKALAQSEGE